jgi:DNA-binding NtrC family response regulator
MISPNSCVRSAPSWTASAGSSAQGISLENLEKELIVKALERFNWNQTHAARYLDLSRRTLIYRMENYGIQKEQPPASP